MSDKIRVAVYLRVACMDDNAIEKQKTTLRIYAQEQGYNDIAEYSDNGYNGLNFDRPAFMQMTNDIRAGLINKIIVKDISRISRNYIQFGEWLDDMRRKNVSVISINDGLDSEKYNAVYASFAEAIRKYYRENHSQRIKSGIAHSRRRKAEQAAKLSD